MTDESAAQLVASIESLTRERDQLREAARKAVQLARLQAAVIAERDEQIREMVATIHRLLDEGWEQMAEKAVAVA